MKSVKKSLVLLVILIILGSSSLYTYSFFKSEGKFENDFVTSKYGVYIDEEFYDTWGTKKVCFVNDPESTVPVLLRINYNELWSMKYDDENILVANNQVSGVDVVTKVWTDEFINDFTLHSDGWFYYNKILEIGEQVCVLESISLNETLISTSEDYGKYKTYDYELDFNFESSQVTNFDSDDWNNKANVNENGEVTWDFS